MKSNPPPLPEVVKVVPYIEEVEISLKRFRTRSMADLAYQDLAHIEYCLTQVKKGLGHAPSLDHQRSLHRI